MRRVKPCGRSRSEPYSTAVREDVARHAPDRITADLDALVEELGEDARIDPFVKDAGRRALESTER